MILQRVNQARIRGFARKLLIGCALVQVGLFASVGPAAAQQDERNGRNAQDGRHDDHQRGNADRKDHRDERDNNRYSHSRGRDYSYSQPVYVPPTEYREPRSSPGISLFLPLDFRR